MFVASRVESGNEGVLALLSQATGYVQTAIGCGTLRRANGIAVQVMVGDPVCPGDVIETAADGQIGIRFIDGTVFSLSCDTRVELNEFVCDSSGTSHSALFAVTRGTFAFASGRLAKTGYLEIDTPVGSIRGRAYAAGIGSLSLVALIFSAMNEVQAAEPNITFLDDDSITYKDLPHGAFELVTKEAIPRHIIVEDPGQTIELSRKGSSVDVNQFANTAARMQELRAAQQDVLANLALGPNGSSTPPFSNLLPVQPINFIQIDAPSGQNSLQPLLYTPIEVHEILLIRPPPTLSLPTGPTEIDTVVFDAFTATGGTFTASSTRFDATITFGVGGGAAGSTVLGGITYDVSKTGLYGTLYLNSTTGAYTFVPESGAINALKAPTTESFIITVSDGTLSSDQIFAIAINGTNDAAFISGAATGTVIEAGGVANATPGTPPATGTLTDTDVDDPPNTFTAVTSPTASVHGYGTFTITAAGVWTYTLDDANSAVQALNAGDTLTDSFTVTSVDGTPKVVTITINGANDAAIISGTTTGSVIEIRGVVNATPGTETATGTLSDTDLDNPPNTFTAVSLPTASAGGYGIFTITAAGVWTYTLDDTNSTVQALNVGDTLTDSFTVTTVDGTPQVVTITIHGPLVGATGTAPSLALSESHLTATALDDNIAGSAPNATLTTTSGNFSTAFTSVQGVDAATISYALSIAGGNGTASGLIDSHTGQADVLVLNGNTIEGHVGATGGALAFTIEVDPTTGVVTFTEYRAVTQPFGTNPDGGEGVSLTAAIVNLTATITETNGDFQTASIDLGRQLTVQDDGPTITASGSAPTPTVDESFLTAATNGIDGSTPDVTQTHTTGNFSTAFTPVQGADSATISYALSITGGNGTASGLLDAQTGLSDVLVLNGNTIEGHVGNAAGALAFTIALDPNTGIVTFTEDRSVKEATASNPDTSEGISLTAGIVNLTATITDKDGDFQTASIDLGKQLTVQDDGPTITTIGSGPALSVDESFLTAATNGINGSTPNLANTHTTGDFSTVFNSVQGADSATITYALSITGGDGTASGLLDAQTGLSDVLVLNAVTGAIEGHVGNAAGALAFTIALDPNTGIVTFTEDRSVKEATASNPDTSEGISLTAGIVNLTATITDKDGDFRTANLDLGKQLTILDDGPTITASGSGPALSVDESFLTAATNGINGSTPNLANTHTTGDFSTVFNSVQGADSATITYALSITGGNGTASGLLDAQTGLSDVLVLNAVTGAIEGHVGNAAGALAFTIALDPNTGIVTFTEDRSVKEATASNPDTSEGISLTAGIVNLTATITDKDGDFQTASIDLGKQLTIQDDGPTIGGFDHATIVAQDNQVVNGSYDVSFGADGDGAMRVAIQDGAVNGYNLATTDLGGGITSVHVTGNGDDYIFYYATHAVSGGVELDAFFTNTSGTLSDPFFTLVIDPNGTYTFDLESVGLLTQVTVNGSDFGASGGGAAGLTSPDGQLHITGSTNAGAALDVKASSNGIAVGDTGLQMDANENLHLNFDQEQTQVSFIFTQWQSNGTADVKFDVFDGGILVHEFDVNVARPPGSGDTHIVVQENVALQNTVTFDSATQTYTFYVGSQFNEIDVDYNHVVSGGATFTVNSITYDQRTIPSTDLLFDVTAVDGDGDSSSTSLQVDLLGGTSAASGLALSSTTSSDALVGGSGNATLTDPFMATTIGGTPQAATTTNSAAVISGTTTGLVLEAGGASPDTPTATGTLTDTDVDKTPNTFTTVSSPAASDGGYGFFTMTAAGVWTYTLDNANSTVDALDVGDTLNDTFTVHTVDGTAQVVTITIHGSSDTDPNDFDSLATGTTVLSDPALVHGTPGHDSIAGGTDVGQIIHGGDTIKGNNGDDTIYGGSGNDTINGNNGNDTIIGGSGADHLAGGNGDDRFVYSSAADSHAGQFDTISDFASRSDKINLTALGALAFLALTSTSTAVPAHTVAWLYDSAANETIVYVNPTDQTLSIGSSSLLEIHLQGIATVQASDFDYEPTTAPVAVAGESIDLAPAATAGNDGIVVTTNTVDVSSVATVNDDARHADGNWTVRTTDVGDSFDAARDWFDLPGHAGFTFGEGRSYATEDTRGDAVITLANGQSIEPNSGHVSAAAENNFAFGQTPAPQPIEHGTTSGDGGWTAGFHGSQFGNGELNPTNAGPMNAAGTHGHTIDAGPNVAHTPAALEALGSHGLVVASSIGSLRGPWTDGGHQTNLGEANGHGVATMGGAGAPGFEASSTAEMMFGWGTAGTRGLGDSFHFKDNISGLAGSNHVDPADVGFTPASISHHENAAGASGPHAISGEMQAIELSPLGQHSADDFSIAPNHVGGGPAITHVPHDLMV